MVLVTLESKVSGTFPISGCTAKRAMIGYSGKIFHLSLYGVVVAASCIVDDLVVQRTSFNVIAHGALKAPSANGGQTIDNCDSR